MSKTSWQAKSKYNKKSYDRMEISVPKGRKADVEAAAQRLGLSVNGLVNALLRDACGLSPEEWNERTQEAQQDPDC